MRFEVFKNGELFKDFVVHDAYLFGTDGIAIRRAQIDFSDGHIVCKKSTMDTAGLALLWEVEEFGKVFLPTTCLPERDHPYNLNVELARAKLMQIINKREDWSFFTNIDGLGDISKEAQELFIHAIQNISDPRSASQLADESLKRATTYAEKLAMKQAQTIFETKAKNRGFGRGCLGCRLDPNRINKRGYLERITELFGFVTIPINWKEMEPSKGEYDFSQFDACISAIGKKRLLLGAGPLVRFSQEYLPEWLMEGSGSFEKVRERAYQFISKVVKRYSDKVHMWVVVSGLNVFNHFAFTFEQLLEMTRATTMAAKAASERGLKVIELSNPWGEYYASKPNTIPPLVYMDMIIQSGISFEAFGLCAGLDGSEAGLYARDIMQTSALLDYFGLTGKPLYITKVEVPSQVPDDSKKNAGCAAIKKWNETHQAQWVDKLYRVLLSKPFVDTVIYSTLADSSNNSGASRGLLGPKLEPKKSYQTLQQLQQEIFRQ